MPDVNILPRRAEALQRFRMVRVVSSTKHALGVSVDGRVFSWGHMAMALDGFTPGVALGLDIQQLIPFNTGSLQPPTQIRHVRVRVGL
mmetsp:Transcript_27139/g.87675  ORF Transcript_27139/g.87675 Transcript_27139/m.87675 type:complete len:88 (-) Transcript_27139:1907-2170(-)